MIVTLCMCINAMPTFKLVIALWCIDGPFGGGGHGFCLYVSTSMMHKAFRGRETVSFGGQ